MTAKIVRTLLIVTTVIAVLVFGLTYYSFTTDSPYFWEQRQPAIENQDPHERAYNTLLELTAEEFSELISIAQLPNLERIEDKPTVVSDTVANDYIHRFMRKEGHNLSSLPVQNLVIFQQDDAMNDPVFLQPLARAAMIELMDAARDDNIPLRAAVTFQSIPEQRVAFEQRLDSAGIVVTALSNGSQDDALTRLLVSYSPPGYSLLHTGYAVHFSCDQLAYERFRESMCFNWLRKDNFKNAKTFGWIPAGPAETPERVDNNRPWEYLWVGKDQVFSD